MKGGEYVSRIFKCNGTESLIGDCENAWDNSYTIHSFDAYVICSNWNNLQTKNIKIYLT